MAGLIKNQILKHLSKFTKNLAADKINLSTLKGEGDLSDLELDELMLTDLLDLPTWLRLTKATCNKLTIKIQWTKLSSQPICLYLDEVNVEMDTCDIPRSPTSTTPVSSYSTGGKYGFAEQIIDGMCVSINSVIVNFRAKDFAASIQLSRILIQSRTPTWQEGSLKLTRLKDDLNGEVMIFKEAEWQTLRVEANARDTRDPLIATTPLRLIANQSKIRITIKKRLADCSIIASRVQVNLDDLLWVLTNSQLRAALTFVGSLRDIVARSTEQSKRLAAEKLRRQAESPMRPQVNAPQQAPAQLSVAGAKTGTQSQLKKAETFARFDIKETSFHVYTGRIELHLCDDMDGQDDVECQKKVKGGAIQLVLERMAFDSYPYHRAGSDRSHWLRRDENMASRDEWSKDLLTEFRQEVLTARDAIASNNNSPNHTSPAPSSPAAHVSKSNSNHQISQAADESKVNKPAQRSAAPNANTGSSSSSKSSRLLESCIVLRLEDFVLYRVSSAIDDRRSSPRKFLSSDKKQLLLPKNMSSVHVEFTEYYFPDGKDFPVPNSNLFIIVNPLCLTVDYITVEWLNAFLIDMAKRAVHDLSRKDGSENEETNPVQKVHIDIRLEALMPRILLPPTTSLDVNIARQFDGLENLQIQLSKVILSNSRVGETGKKLRSDLHTLINSVDHGRLLNDQNRLAPSAPSDLVIGSSRISSLLRQHADKVERPHNTACESAECIQQKSSTPDGANGLRADMFQSPASNDIWCVEVDQIWFEFVVNGVADGSVRRRRTVPFIDSFPVVIWMSPLMDESKASVTTSQLSTRPSSFVSHSKPLSSSSSSSSSTNVCLLVRAGAREIKAQIDHKRFAFLMSLVDTIIQVKEEIDLDLVSGGMTPSDRLVLLSAFTSDVRVDLLLAPVDEYSMRPTSPDDEDEEDANNQDTNNIGESPAIADHNEVVQVDLPTLLNTDPGSVSSGVVEDITNSYDSFLPPSVTLSGPDMCHGGIGSHDAVSDSSSLIMPDCPPNSLKPAVSDSSIGRNSSFHSDQVLVGAPGMNYIPTEGSVLRSSVVQRNWSKSSSPPDLKKSINQVFGKISDRMKVRRQDTTGRFMGDSDADSWDTMSTRSDVPSDEDDDATSFIFGLESQHEQPAFERRDDVNGAGDDTSVDASDSHEELSDICTELKSPGLKLISVVSVYLHGIEASVTVDNQDIAVDNLLGDLALKERGNMSIEKFQELFISGNRDKTEGVLSWLPRPCPVASLHIDVGQLAKRMLSASYTADDARYLTVSVCNLELVLRITTLTNINELFNDGKESKVLPMQIEASDVFITLLDDQKSLYNDVPPLTPIKFRVKTAAVQRDEYGVFHISAGSKVPSFSTALSESIVLPSTDSSIGMGHMDLPGDQLSSDLSRRKSSSASILLPPDVSARLADLEHENDLLRRQLEKIGKMDGLAIERSSRPSSREQSATRDRSAGSGRKEVDRLRKENSELIDRLREQADDMMAMKQERESLLLTIQLLQDDLTVSERQRQRQTPT